MPTPSCRFDPQQMNVWSSQTGLCFVSDPHEGYRLAKPFLLEQMRKLLGQGWQPGDKTSDQDVLFHLYIPHNLKKDHDIRPREIVLPENFDSFLDPTKAETWRTVFEQPKVFKARYNEKIDDHQYPNLHLAPQPQLSNIFHILQILAPGMLVIRLESTALQGNENLEVSRVLPTASWIESCYSKLGFTPQGGMSALVSAANNPNSAFLSMEGGQRHQPANLSETHPSDFVTSTVALSSHNDPAGEVIQPNHRTQPSSKVQHRNLPFPMTLVRPENLKSIQAPNAAAQTTVSPSHLSYSSYGNGIEATPLEMTEPTPPVLSESSTAGNHKKTSKKKKAPRSAAGFSASGSSGNSGGPSTVNNSKQPPKNKKAKTNTSASNPRRTREPRYRIIEGSFLPRTSYSGYYDSGGYDWAVCSKDCGWCGRCVLEEY